MAMIKDHFPLDIDQFLLEDDRDEYDKNKVARGSPEDYKSLFLQLPPHVLQRIFRYVEYAQLNSWTQRRQHHSSNGPHYPIPQTHHYDSEYEKAPDSNAWLRRDEADDSRRYKLVAARGYRAWLQEVRTVHRYFNAVAGQRLFMHVDATIDFESADPDRATIRLENISQSLWAPYVKHLDIGADIWRREASGLAALEPIHERAISRLRPALRRFTNLVSVDFGFKATLVNDWPLKAEFMNMFQTEILNTERPLEELEIYLPQDSDFTRLRSEGRMNGFVTPSNQTNQFARLRHLGLYVQNKTSGATQSPPPGHYNPHSEEPMRTWEDVHTNYEYLCIRNCVLMAQSLKSLAIGCADFADLSYLSSVVPTDLRHLFIRRGRFSGNGLSQLLQRCSSSLCSVQFFEVQLDSELWEHIFNLLKPFPNLITVEMRCCNYSPGGRRGNKRFKPEQIPKDPSGFSFPLMYGTNGMDKPNLLTLHSLVNDRRQERGLKRLVLIDPVLLNQKNKKKNNFRYAKFKTPLSGQGLLQLSDLQIRRPWRWSWRPFGRTFLSEHQYNEDYFYFWEDRFELSQLRKTFRKCLHPQHAGRRR